MFRDSQRTSFRTSENSPENLQKHSSWKCSQFFFHPEREFLIQKKLWSCLNIFKGTKNFLKNTCEIFKSFRKFPLQIRSGETTKKSGSCCRRLQNFYAGSISENILVDDPKYFLEMFWRNSGKNPRYFPFQELS